MTTRSLVPLACCLLTLPSGCAGPQLAPVLVRDAETRAPVPGAQVQLSTPRGAEAAAVTAGPDGVARIAGGGDGALLAQVSASGYLPRDADLTGRLGHADPAVVELFAGPRPTVELVLPDRFRGVVRARVRVDADAPAGGRAFTAVVPASGVVEVVGPAVLAQAPGPEFTARYASGGQLAAEADDAAVALRWVWTEGPVEVFVVGTRSDQATAVRELGYAPTTGGSRGRSGTSGGRGGGHGGHRGGGGGGGGGGFGR